MKKQIYILLLTLAIFATEFKSIAQVPIIEKSYDISRKAKNGYLAKVDMNSEKETIDMIYILPSLLPRKVKYEVYTYDKDLNLLNTEREEEWIDKVKTRWSWFNYKGEKYVAYTLTASVAMMGKVVFRKKEITYSYDWWAGRYTKKVKQLDKVKPKTDTDAKYDYRASYEIEQDSTVLVMASLPVKKTVNTFKDYEIMSCDNQINITTVEKFDFKYGNIPIFSAPISDEMNFLVTNDEMPRDWIVVFAPINCGKDNTDPVPTNFTYLRISPKGKIKERFNFTSPSNGWRISGAYEKDGSVFLYGAGITKSPEKKFFSDMGLSASVPTTSASAEEKKMSMAAPGGIGSGFKAMSTTDYGVTQEDLNNSLDLLKYTNFQIGKVTNSKFDFINSPNIEEFEKKQAKPLNQKKFVVFDGSKFVMNGISFTSDGSIFFSGQDFTIKDNVKVYRGIYMFQFEKDGTLKKNYGVLVDQKKKKGMFSDGLSSDMFIADSYIEESGDKQKLYWILRSAKTIVKQSDSQYPLFGIDYGSINIANGELSEFREIGEDEKRDYFLFPNTAGYHMGNYVYFFNESKKGGSILLSRMDISK